VTAAGPAAAASARRNSARIASRPSIPTRCGSPAGIHSAWPGGTTKDAASVEIRITPRVA
jgi:hypothetical protein